MNRDAEDAVLKNLPDEPDGDAPAVETPAAAGATATEVPRSGKMPQTQSPASAR